MTFGLMVTSYPYGGAEKQAKAFADFIQKKGHRVTIIAIKNKNNTINNNIEIVGLGIEPISFSILNIIKLIKYYWLLRKSIYDKYDVLITYPQNYFLPIIAGKKTLKVISIRIFYPNSVRYVRRKLLKYFDLVITNNIPQLSLLTAYNIPTEIMNNKISNINNNNNNNKKFISNKIYLLVANIKKRKNIELPIKVFQALVDYGYQLYIVGRVEDEEYYHELIKIIEKTSNIQYHGNKNNEELKKLYKEVEGIILSSKREGAANAILDAMAIGVPALVYRIPENIVLIENKDDFLFKNEYELKNRIISLHYAVRNNEVWLRNYVQMQQEKIRQAYIGNDYEKVLNKIIRYKRSYNDK